VIQVPFLLGSSVADPAERRDLGPRPEPGLDLVLDGIRQLDAATAEELDPVVLGRIVARG
jgi:hypothetical protein